MMNIDDTLRTGLISVAALVVPIIVGMIARLPAGLYITVGVVLAAIVVFFAVRRRLDGTPTGAKVRPQMPASPTHASIPPPSHVPLSPVPLPSADPDYRFRFSATVSWVTDTRQVAHADPAALAREAILDRAAAIAEQVPPSDHALVQHRMASSLGVRVQDRSRQVSAWATEIQIEFDERDVEQLRQLADLRRDVQLWEHKRGHEINVRQYLGDDVLRSTGSALVWWIARDYDRVEDAVSRIAPFTRISAVAQGHNDPGPSVEAPQPLHVVRDATDATARASMLPSDPVQSTRELIDQLLPDATDDERGMFAEHLADSVTSYGIGEFGDRLREAYGVQRFGTSSEIGDDDLGIQGPVDEQHDQQHLASGGDISATRTDGPAA